MLLFYKIVGYTASAASVGAQLPQIVKTFRTREVSALSLATQVLHTLIAALWILYGCGFAASNDLPDALIMIVPSGCKCVTSAVLVATILQFRHRDIKT